MSITESGSKYTPRVADFPTSLYPTLPPIYTPISSSAISFVIPAFFQPKQHYSHSSSSIAPLATDSSKAASKILTLVPNLDKYTKQETNALPPDVFVFNELCEDSCRLYDDCDSLDSIVDPALLDLRICRCGHMNFQQRAAIENAAIDALITHYDRHALLTIVSVGSGGCYQELVYLARLAKAGYHNFHLVLIEPKEVPLESLRRVCRRYLPECRLDVVHYFSLESYTQNDPRKANLLLLLDLTDLHCRPNGTPLSLAEFVMEGFRGKPLSHYAFELLQEKQLMLDNAVIAWDSIDSNPDEENPSISRCGLYRGETTLDGLTKKEIVYTHIPLGNSERPPYKRVFKK